MASNTPGFGATAYEQESDRTLKALGEFLRPEFINRVDEIVTFRSLEKEDFVKISGLMLAELKETLAVKRISVEWTSEAQAFIAEKSFSRRFGARNMRRYVQTHVEDEIADLIIKNYNYVIKSVKIDAPDENNSEKLNIMLEYDYPALSSAEESKK